ncbi:MAG: extracellular solute-binding protein [Anaerolineae bacterium]|nr:extracellular solute-binding protein [Anaerolineae bacterium]
MCVRNMLSRVLALTLVLALLSGALVSVSAQEEVTLTVSFPGDPRSDTVNALIDAFVAMKAEAGVAVNVVINEPTDAYDDQLLLDFSAGVGPDVFSVSPERIPELVTAGLMLPLDDYVAAWDEWENFPSGMQLMPSYNGSTYAVMYNTDTRVLFYRTDIFEAAGLDVPFEPTSWEDIFAAAEQIQTNLPDVIPMEVEAGTIWGEGTTMDGFFMLFRGAGGTLLDTETGQWIVESPALLQAFEFYERMFGEGYSLAEPFMEPEPWAFWLQEAMPNGELGMALIVNVVWGLYAPGSDWAGIDNRDEVLAWTPFPAREPGAGINGWDYIGMGGGWGWAISNETENADLAWEFVQFMTSADSIAAYAEGVGGVPSRSDAPTDEHNAAIAELVLPYQSFRPGDVNYARVSEQIQIATERIMLGEATAAEAMQLFAAAVEDIVGAENVMRLPME